MEKERTEINENKSEVKRKKPWSKKKKIIVAVIVVVVLITCGGFVSCVASIAKMSADMMETMGDYGEATVGDIEVITEGSGMAEAVEKQNVMIDYTCDVVTLYKQNGEQVQAGEVIATFAPVITDTNIDALEQSLDSIDTQLAYTDKKGSSSITAPANGRVKAIYGEAGQDVAQVMQEHGALMLLSGDDKLQVTVSGVNTDGIAIGNEATVTIGDIEAEGKVAAIQGNDVTVTFEDSDSMEIQVEATVAVNGTQLGSGMVECHLPITVTGTSGTIDSISVDVNKKVSSGNTLFKLKNVDYSDDYMALVNQREELVAQLTEAKAYMSGYTVVAEKTGIISEMTVVEGDTVMAGTKLCTVLGNDSYQVKVEIDELDIRGIATGQNAVVTFDAIENQEFTGQVSTVSLVGTNPNGVASYTVTVLLNETEGILPGMSANAKITTGMQEGVILIPVECIQTMDGEKCVIRFNDDGSVETLPIKIGLVNNTSAEIIEGVNEGDKLQKVVTMEDIYSQMGLTMEVE